MLRFFSFFPSVIDQDEATYFEIGRQLLEGKELYVDYIDIKPPGMFMIMAGFQAIAGNSSFFIRLFSALWIGLTAILLFRTIVLLLGKREPGLAGGVIYIFMVSCWAFYGLSVNTEIFFNLFTVLALYFFLRNRGGYDFLIGGFAVGFGVLIKQVMIFDILAFFVFFMILVMRDVRTKSLITLGRKILLATAGFLIPLGVAVFYFHRLGNLDEFQYIVLTAPRRYPTVFHAGRMAVYILDFVLRYAPVFFLYFWFILRQKGPNNRVFADYRLLGIIWTIFALVAVLIPGNRFGHYTVQLMLPVSFTAAGFFHPESPKPAWLLRFFRPVVSILLAGVLAAGIVLLQKMEFFDKPDIPREVADYLNPRLGHDDRIYSGNFNHIVYFLLEKDSPTPYLHQSLLLQENHIRTLGIDTLSEYSKIRESRPLFIISKTNPPPSWIRGYIDENYELIEVIRDEAFIFQKIVRRL
jgi:4-amino-4-deoxy-L-arabinose transferase-like glycosyltransferase